MSILAAFADERPVAERLASQLAVPLRVVALHRFPDGESLPAVPVTSGAVVLYRSLNAPDRKLTSLMLAADAWRRSGASRLTLVAPYLCYMRQDKVFRPGEPLSRDVMAGWLRKAFDRVITVDPHLHRTHDLAALLGPETLTLSAGSLLADAIGPGADDWVIVGPDAESAQWASRVASALGAPSLMLSKTRLGDRSVRLSPDSLELVRGRAAVVVDDVSSSGGTLRQAAQRLIDAGARSVDVAVTHSLLQPADERRLHRAGVRRILCTDSCRPDGPVRLAALLASTLKDDFK
jgi:ribose-phosphate pyrophosphokinase